MFLTSHLRTPPFALLICILLPAGALLALGGGRPAQAQQVDAPEKDTTIHVEAETRKSPARAQAASIGATLVPVFLGSVMGKKRDEVRIPLLAGGFFIGPSVGHFYAENTGQALTGIGLRLGGTALGVLGLGVALNSSLEGESGGGGSALLLIGGLTVLTSAGYDIFTAGDAARDYNETHGLKARVGPAVGPRGEQVGLAVQVQF